MVSACQERSYAEDVELLMQQGNDIQWLMKGVDTSEEQGISDNPENLKSREELFGSNQKYAK